MYDKRIAELRAKLKANADYNDGFNIGDLPLVKVCLDEIDRLRTKLARVEDAIRSAHVFGEACRICPFCEARTENDSWPSNHKFDCIILTLEK